MKGYYIIKPLNDKAIESLYAKCQLNQLYYTPSNIDDSDIRQYLINLFGYDLGEISNWSIERITIK